eukprot:TRINITY_DN6080_c0_g1_i5.p1 TRINITY_DN6080_c0_g1~~TRINITY_DN6080_c0_g1_i5.p1  ORF type:complete len:299 (+),score=63.14 TRINITY_DN6080_c0_g1_i5:57-953(+)
MPRGNKKRPTKKERTESHVSAYVADPLLLQKLDNLRATEGGTDTDKLRYESYDIMWANNFQTSEKTGQENDVEGTSERPVLNRDQWYGKSEEYWKGIDATVDGMLGGMEHVSEIDLRESSELLRRFLSGQYKRNLKPGSALDVGAGIGRISKFLLSRFFETVDLLEVTPKFLEVAKKDLVNIYQIRNYFCSSVQDFTFTEKYDMIWIQWVIIYLSDDDFISFLRKCREFLTPTGLILVKDNVTNSGFVLDKIDSSVTRSEAHVKLLFQVSGLRIIHEKQQPGFPKDLFPVKMFALCPI